ncbi:MAG: putative toxin-antitoxin system toxin component, PIN family [Deltaproteobacteria bacterium]|nr:putative toxin-antitoxin system toxin component, PIN family [Deltaproteobacteria bacterium]
MRIVFDANVLVAAFAARGLCAALFAACLGAHDCATSDAILDETEAALRRKIRLPASRAAAIRGFLGEHLRRVTPAAVESDRCRDRSDLLAIGTAVAAEADLIVSGDKDLLVLGRCRNIPILTPRALWDRLRSTRSAPRAPRSQYGANVG